MFCQINDLVSSRKEVQLAVTKLTDEFNIDVSKHDFVIKCNHLDLEETFHKLDHQI